MKIFKTKQQWGYKWLGVQVVPVKLMVRQFQWKIMLKYLT